MNYLKHAIVQFFNFIHGGVSQVITNPNYSYGIAIILVTVIIKLIIIPLNIKQIRSSLRMSKLQPEIKKIQQKYKNNPQKLQQETMKLYKENNASPMGGCLPMLIQWPILLALYWVFNDLQGISGVSFLWIKDLAKPDIILAVLSGVTTYFSGAMMMSKSSDQSQGKQMNTMNIGMGAFMIFISWRLKSALVLYWAVSNLIQIGMTVVAIKIENNRDTGKVKA